MHGSTIRNFYKNASGPRCRHILAKLAQPTNGNKRLELSTTMQAAQLSDITQPNSPRKTSMDAWNLCLQSEWYELSTYDNLTLPVYTRRSTLQSIANKADDSISRYPPAQIATQVTYIGRRLSPLTAKRLVRVAAVCQLNVPAKYSTIDVSNRYLLITMFRALDFSQTTLFAKHT